MNRRIGLAVFAVVATTIAVWTAATVTRNTRRLAHNRVAASRKALSARTTIDSLPSESEIRDRDIVFYERRAAEDTISASDRSR